MAHTHPRGSQVPPPIRVNTKGVLERQVSLEEEGEGGREEWLIHTLGVPRYCTSCYSLITSESKKRPEKEITKNKYPEAKL